MELELISRLPVGRPNPTPLLFIHGMLHAAWCWEAHFLDYFARQGFEAHAVNLRGHGNSPGWDRLRWTRIADFVLDVEDTAARLSRPPVLIGHSMGGFIIQKYLESHDSPGAVLLSSPSPAGLLPTVLRIARRQPLAFAKSNLTFSLKPTIATPQMAREAFFSDALPDEQIRKYWAQMQDESYRALLDMVALDLPRPAKVKAPLLVLGAGLDNMLHPREIEATARTYRTRAQIVPGVGHDSMLEPRWQAVAERILDWLQERENAAHPLAAVPAGVPV
jgi:pimeloyl-ACP methyl ester carboxylesterase